MEQKDLAQKVEPMLEEARMVLPGIQALFGFQFIAVFNSAFQNLVMSQRMVHFVAMLSTLVATALIMTPAAYHRIVEPDKLTEFFLHFSSRLITGAMLFLRIALTLDTWLVTTVIVQSAILAFFTASIVFVVFGLFWFIFPFGAKIRASQTGD